MTKKRLNNIFITAIKIIFKKKKRGAMVLINAPSLSFEQW